MTFLKFYPLHSYFRTVDKHQEFIPFGVRLAFASSEGGTSNLLYHIQREFGNSNFADKVIARIRRKIDGR